MQNKAYKLISCKKWEHGKMKKYYYVWVGQNATTGTPHQQTGLLSMYGRFYRFDSRKLRDEYYDTFYSNNPSEYCVKVNKHSGRRYMLGVPVHSYLESLELALWIVKDKNGNWQYEY